MNRSRYSRTREVRSGTASPRPHPGRSKLAWFLPSCRMTSRWREIHSASIPGVGKGTCWDSQVGGREKGAGSKPSSSHAGLSLSQTSCCQSPFRRFHYGASPALSDESVPGASRGTGSQSGPASLQKGPVGERRQGGWKMQVWVARHRESSFGPMRNACSTSEQEERVAQHRQL